MIAKEKGKGREDSKCLYRVIRYREGRSIVSTVSVESAEATEERRTSKKTQKISRLKTEISNRDCLRRCRIRESWESSRPTGFVALGAAITAIEHFVRGFEGEKKEAGITRA